MWIRKSFIEKKLLQNGCHSYGRNLSNSSNLELPKFMGYGGNNKNLMIEQFFLLSSSTYVYLEVNNIILAYANSKACTTKLSAILSCTSPEANFFNRNT